MLGLRLFFGKIIQVLNYMIVERVKFMKRFVFRKSEADWMDIKW